MKKKTLFAAISASALCLASSTTASAALLFGFHTFSDLDTPEGASEGVFSATSQVTKTESSSSTGGSNDGSYGGSALTSGGADNGYIKLSAFNPTVFSIFNSSATAYSLDALYFDFSRAVAPGAGDVPIQLDTDGVDGYNFLTYQDIMDADTSVDVDTDYLDSSIFFVDFGGRSLAPGENFSIWLTAYDSDVVIDNIALTGTAVVGVPEVANFAALGGLLISGLTIRSRRRTSTKA